MNRESSFLWLPGWASPSSIWDQEIKRWPNAIHRKVEFTQCETKETIFAEAKKHLLELSPNIYIIGWSLGAFVALDLLKTYPDMIHSLHLIGAGTQFISSNTYSFGWDKRIIRLMKKRLHTNKKNVLEEFDKKMFTIEEQNMGYFKNWKDQRQQAPPLSSLLAGLNYLLEVEAKPKLTQTKTPVFLLAGEKDQVTPLSGAIHLKEFLSNCNLEIWKNVGHVPMFRNPDLFHHWLKEYILG